jgi:parallel beta-helix repeat protein
MGGENNLGTVYAYNSPNTTVKNCSIKNCLKNHPTDEDKTTQGVYITQSENSVIANNTIDTVDGYGIHTYYADNVIIVGNTLTNVNGDAIYSSYSNNSNVTGNSVSETKLNPYLDFDSLYTKNNANGEARSGCGIFISRSTGVNIGKAYTYDGIVYEGNDLYKTANYGISLNICVETYIYKANCNYCQNNALHSSASAQTTIENCKLTNTTGMGITFAPGSLSSNPVDNATGKNSVVRGNIITSTTSYGIWCRGADGIKIVGNTISKSEGDGILLNNCKNGKISGNKVTNTIVTNKSGEPSSRGSGIMITSSSNNIAIGSAVTVLGKAYGKNTISNVKKYGIGVAKSSSVTIHNNQISSSTGNGINVLSGTSCTVSSNKILKSQNNGITANNSEKTVIKNNTVTLPNQNGITTTSNCNNTTIQSNTVTNSKKMGISLNKSSNTKLTSNKISKAGFYGIYVAGNKKVTATGNTILLPVKSGIVVKSSSNVNVKNMTVPKISTVTTKSRKLTAKITQGSSAKIKVGNKFYKCTVKKGNATSAKFPKQKKGATITFYEYPGSGNVVTTQITVK